MAIVDDGLLLDEADDGAEDPGGADVGRRVRARPEDRPEPPLDIEEIIRRTADRSAETASELAVQKALKRTEKIAEDTANRMAGEVCKQLESRLTAMEEWKTLQGSAGSQAAPSLGGFSNRSAGIPCTSPKVPKKCVELKGWIVDWEDPDATALLQSDGKNLLNEVVQALEERHRNLVDMEESLNGLTRWTLVKIVVYLKNQNTDDAWRLRETINKVIEAKKKPSTAKTSCVWLKQTKIASP